MRPSNEVVARLLDQEIVLVQVATNRIFELNESGARVWQLLGDGCDIEEIAHRLTKEFEVDEMKAATEVKDLVAQLSAAGLLVS